MMQLVLTVKIELEKQRVHVINILVVGVKAEKH